MMVEPELKLWRQTKPIHVLLAAQLGHQGLVRVSFDEAVERMVEWERKQEAVPTPATDDALRAACESALCTALNIARPNVKTGAPRRKLRAAAEEKP